MSTSMISTVLEIEREAENVLGKADQDIAKLLAEAKDKRDAVTKEYEEKIRKEIAAFETKALAERAAKVKELAAKGDTALAAVKNISTAAFDSGVQKMLSALAGK